MQHGYKDTLAWLALAMGAALAACQDDDFGGKNAWLDNMGIIVSVPESWQGGANYAPPQPASHCATVTLFDESGEQPLYLHTTTESDTLRYRSSSSRGTMVGKENFHDHFSLSAICYVGDYPSEAENAYTPNFAYHHKYNSDGSPAEGYSPLDWPGKGSSIKFFAFAPYEHEGIALSVADKAGSPCIEYAIAADAKAQTDLMVAVADARNKSVTLEFDHVLTAVKVKAAPTMMKCKVNKVTLSGIRTKGSYNMGAARWTLGDATGSCHAAFDADDAADAAAAPSIVDGEYTFLMLPQTLGEGATLTIEFVDDLTGTVRTVSGSIGKSDGSAIWPEAKVVTYEVSTSSISVAGSFEISGIPTASDYKLPYTGVLYDINVKPKATMSQAGVSGTQEATLADLSGLKAYYSTNNGATWTEIADAANAFTRASDNAADGFTGAFDMSAGSPYGALSLGAGFSDTPLGDKTAPQEMHVMHGQNETANCYMTDAPGYYSFPVVYGNALKNGAANASAYNVQTVSTGAVQGMDYYVDHKNQQIGGAYIPNADHAILVWQDSPDLVRDVRLTGKDKSDSEKRVEFHINKRTIAQGNAMIAVRDKDSTILWSWHIWVTTTSNLNGWKTGHRLTSKVKDGDKEKTFSYYLTPSNLGYCDSRQEKPEQTMMLKIGGTVSYKSQGHADIKVVCPEQTFTFAQEGVARSMAGDNPYYQWGRKDPMPPGVYNETQKKKYIVEPQTLNYGTGTSSNSNDISRKKLYSVPLKYKHTRTPVAWTTGDDDLQGVNIGYTIQHPNEHIMGKDCEIEAYPEKGLLTDNGYANYRKHWHRSRGEGYLPKNVPGIDYVMYHLWNSSATGIGKSDTVCIENYQTVTKTIYDPCPAGFHVPNIGAFFALSNAAGGATYYCGKMGNHPKLMNNDTYWSVKDSDGGELRFYAVGMRDLNYKAAVNDSTNLGTSLFPGYETQSWCSFNKISYISSSTIAYTPSNTYQELIFFADHRGGPAKSKLDKDDTYKPTFRYGAGADSNDAYGMSIRPVKDYYLMTETAITD